MSPFSEWLGFWAGYWLVTAIIPAAVVAGLVLLIRWLMRRGKQETAVVVGILLVLVTVAWLVVAWGSVRATFGR